MNTEVGAYLPLLTGVLVLRLALTDLYLAYVKPGLRPWLLAAGVALLVLGVTGLVRSWRGRRGAPSDAELAADSDVAELEHEHDHGGPRVAWLLVLPLVAVFFVVPDPLGAYAAGRADAVAPPPPSDGYEFPPLPPAVDGAVALPLGDFLGRALYDQDRERLLESPVRLVGFAAPVAEGDAGDFLLTRFTVSCCAADGRPIQVGIRLDGLPVPATDTWVEVTGTWLVPPGGQPGPDPQTGEAEVLVAVDTLTVIEQPSEPYET